LDSVPTQCDSSCPGEQRFGISISAPVASFRLSSSLSLDRAGYRNKPVLIKARNRHVDLVIYIQASSITTGCHYESCCSKECEHQKFSSQSRVWVQDVMRSSLGSSQMSLLRW
jgi:hypothetical protein